MGLALRLFPIDHLSTLSGYSHNVLEVGDLNWDLGEQIQKQARRLPYGHDITTYLAQVIPNGDAAGARYYGKLANDVYGDPYRWLTAEELLPFLSKHWPKHPVTAYVRALPSDRLIVLDWH